MITIVTNVGPAIDKDSTGYKVEVLVAGAILATGQRTMSGVLRVMGLSQGRNDAQYHPGLSRAKGSGLEVSAILLGLLLKAFDRGEALVLGVDRTGRVVTMKR